jgi:hypothetical protein
MSFRQTRLAQGVDQSIYLRLIFPWERSWDNFHSIFGIDPQDLGDFRPGLLHFLHLHKGGAKGKVRKHMIRLALEQLSANRNRFFISPRLSGGNAQVA